MKRYHYVECGLDNVIVEGVEITCDADGEEVVCIPAIGALHKAISEGILRREGAMSGKELRFLRTEMGMTQAELGQLLHRDAQTIARWEKEEIPIDGNADTVVRRLAAEKLDIDLDVTTEELARRTVPNVRPREIVIRRAENEGYEVKAA